MNTNNTPRRSMSDDDYGDGYYDYSSKRKNVCKEPENIYSSSRYGSYFEDFEKDDSNEIFSNSSSYRERNRNVPKRTTRKGSDERRPKDRKTKKNKRRSHKKIIITIVSILLSLVLIVCGAGLIFINRIAGKVNYVPVDSKYSRQALLEDGGDSLVSDSSVKNILLLGVDEDTSEYGRSDSMMLLSIDKKNKKIKMTSFQRDTFVYIPDPDGGYRSKLTNAYSWGGVGLTLRTIEENFGIRIDNYITINFETFKTIVDILGGVEIELTDREILYINCQIAQNNQTEYLDAEAGKVRLNGQQALWHARNRGGDVINGVEFYEGTDWDRTQRQRNFLQAIIKGVKKASPLKLLRLADGVSPHITTDIEKKELKKLLISCISYRKYDVSQCSMPCDDTWSYENNFAGNVIAVYDWDTVHNTLKNFVYED